MGRLLGSMREAGAGEQITALAPRAATHAALDKPHRVATLLLELRNVGAGEQVTALTARAASNFALDHLEAYAAMKHILIAHD
ncbi:hypothetical protein ABZ476_34165, partial [Streptomyces albogriseolus]|uniref:hypothetical protein n=1 Tax=Streptomyces albogriseolus TaxID=1887 RepID=UPI00345F2432